MPPALHCLDRDVIFALVRNGYRAMKHFPNSAESPRWNELKTECGFSNAQRNQVINALFPAVQPSNTFFINNLNRYLFNESESKVLAQSQKVHFSTHSLGMASLPRTALVSQILAELEKQMQESDLGPYNVYLYGMRASEKTIALTQIAKQLQDEGYTVYFFCDARSLQNSYHNPAVKLL